MAKKIKTTEISDKELEVEAGRLEKWFGKTEYPLDVCKDFVFYLISKMKYDPMFVIGMLEMVKLDFKKITDRIIRDEMMKEEK